MNHAGLAADRSALHGGLQDDWPDVRGAIIGTAYLTGCHKARIEGCCGPWSFPGTWHWLLALVRPLAVPVPAKGQLGLWTPDADVLAAVEAQQTARAA